jgi:hypothetical protein
MSLGLRIGGGCAHSLRGVPDADDKCAISDLPLHDQLLHGIGRVAQAQVQVEMILRHLYTGLTMPSVAAAYLGAKRNSIDQLAQDCRVMLANSDLPDDIKTAGNDALIAGIEADKLRHKVVHEWWVQKMDSDDEPNTAPYERLRAARTTIGYTSEPGDLAFVNDAEAALGRAYIRINSLVFAVTNLMVFGGAPPPGVPYDPELLPSIRGEFTLLPDGGWRPDSATAKG